MILTAIITLLGVVICASSLARLAALDPERHKAGWRLMYVVFGGYAAHCIWYATTAKPAIEILFILAGGQVAIGLNLALTHWQWKSRQVPPIAHKSLG